MKEQRNGRAAFSPENFNDGNFFKFQFSNKHSIIEPAIIPN